MNPHTAFRAAALGVALLLLGSSTAAGASAPPAAAGARAGQPGVPLNLVRLSGTLSSAAPEAQQAESPARLLAFRPLDIGAAVVRVLGAHLRQPGSSWGRGESLEVFVPGVPGSQYALYAGARADQPLALLACGVVPPTGLARLSVPLTDWARYLDDLHLILVRR